VPEHYVFISFGLICVTSPTFGAVISSKIGDSMKGGYHSKNALPLCFWVLFASFWVGMLLLYFSNWIIINVLLWIFLFLGAIAVPFMTGIMLNSVTQDHKAAANSIANFIYNMLGYLPAPYLYGVISEKTGGKTSKWGMIVTFLVNILTCVFIGLAILSKDEKEEKDDEFSQNLIEKCELEEEESQLSCLPP